MTDFTESYLLKIVAGWALVGLTLISVLINIMISIGISFYEIGKRVRWAI